MNDLDTDRFREVFLKHTCKAYDLIPKIENPRILDVGCGSGVPTIELAKLSTGDIIGIDIDQSALDKFRKKLNNNNLTARITIRHASLLEFDFPENSFDIIWAEGSIHLIGFKKSVDACHRFLKRGGVLVIGGTMERIEEHINLIEQSGFKLFNKLVLPEDMWLKEFYIPLENYIKSIDHSDLTPDQVKQVKKINDEIKTVRGMTPEELKCAFYILQKE